MIATRQDRDIARAELVALSRQTTEVGRRLTRAARRRASASDLQELEDEYLALWAQRELAADRL